MRMLYLAWRYGGLDPYCLYNGLTKDYRPLEAPDGDRFPPPEPRRVRNVLYAFGLAAGREAYELAALASAAAMGGGVA